MMQTSIRPSAMEWTAYPMASSPDVQPVETVWTGPRAPVSSATAEARVAGVNARCRNGPALLSSTSHQEPDWLTAT